MARETILDALAFNFWFMSGQFGAAKLDEASTYSLAPDSLTAQYVNTTAPGTAIRLPPVSLGKFFIISNVGSQDLDIQTANGLSLYTLPAGQSNVLHSEGASWLRLVPNAIIYTVFGPEGPGAHDGLVPSPGAAQAQLRFLGSDGQWHGAFGNTLLDGFSFVTDGTHTASATGNDTLRVRSSTGKITATVTDNEAVFGDNINFDVVEAQVDHNLLKNYSANQHIDHTAVTLTAGNGLSGGGDISASRTFDLDVNDLSVAAAVVLTDTFPFYDVSATATVKATFTSLNAILVHDNLSGFNANRHIDHTAVTISVGTGLSGGGDISASRTISLDFSGLPTQAQAMASGDLFPFYDLSDTTHKKISWGTINSSLDHDALTNFVANKHIDHSTVTVTGAGGLTGGGDITASRTLDMSSNQKTANITFIIDGGGSAITTGIKGDLEVSFAGTITGVTLLADQSGSIVVDIWKDTYANYPPTVADTITAAAKPTLSGADKSKDTTLTGWTTAIAAGSTLRYNVDSAATVQRVLVSLTVTKT